jgi:hypothetical protein
VAGGEKLAKIETPPSMHNAVEQCGVLFAVMKTFARLLLILFLCLPLLAQTTPAPATQTVAAPVSASTASAVQSTEGNPDVRVWVNTATGVYHCPGSRWYGNTKQGEYMTQAEAQKKHYRPAYGKVCR